MRTEKVNLAVLSKLCNNKKGIIDFLQNHKLLGKNYKCPTCSRDMLLSETSRSSDGYEWICRSQKLGVKHRMRRSIRKGSWFDKSRMTLKQIIYLVYYWATEYPQRIVIHEMELSNATVVDWYNLCRELCLQIISNKKGQNEDLNTTDEVDEPKNKKTKDSSKRTIGQWVFGGADGIMYRREVNKDGDFFIQFLKDISTIYMPDEVDAPLD